MTRFSRLDEIGLSPRRLVRGDADVATVRIRESGLPQTEEVPVEDLSDVRHRVLATPTLVSGCAAGDVIEVAEDGTFSVRSRGGNVSVLIEIEGPLGDLPVDVANRIDPLDGWVDGWFDGSTGSIIVGTIPVETGFAAIEETLRGLAADRRGVEWYFGNVYADGGGEPLNWWLE